jgi:predicted methyltransferase
MKPIALLAVLALLTPLAHAADAAEVPAYIAAAVADGGRPAEDTARDADRKPAEVLAFAGVKPGDRIIDFMPGKGYFTRIFSKIAGPNGVVYAFVPDEVGRRAPQALQGIKTLASQPAYSNVVVMGLPAADFRVPRPVDLVWTSQNYHDLHNAFMAPIDIGQFNHAVFNALKPGGIYLVLDHATAAGSGLAHTGDLHRIDPATVKAEVTAAGFELVDESSLLHNPDDPHTAKVFDPSIRGKTDQFILKFRRPAK